MKITTIKTTTEEKEIDLPYFSKSINEAYCILSENRCITVIYREYASLPPSVYIQETSEMSSAMRGDKITAKEFENAYERATDYLHTEFEVMRDAIREKKNEIYDNVTINGEGDE